LGPHKPSLPARLSLPAPVEGVVPALRFSEGRGPAAPHHPAVFGVACLGRMARFPTSNGVSRGVPYCSSSSLEDPDGVFVLTELVKGHRLIDRMKAFEREPPAGLSFRVLSLSRVGSPDNLLFPWQARSAGPIRNCEVPAGAVVVEDDVSLADLVDQGVVPLFTTVGSDLRSMQVDTKIGSVSDFEPEALSRIGFPPSMKVQASFQSRRHAKATDRLSLGS
jgi:hypothetical protein